MIRAMLDRSPLGRVRQTLPRLLVVGAMVTGVVATALPVAAQDVATPAAGASAAASHPTMKAVPETAALYMAVDTNRDSAQWSQAEELFGRLGLPNALDELHQMASEQRAGGDMGQAPTQADVDALLGGEIAVAVTSDAVAEFSNRSGQLAMMPMAPGGAMSPNAQMDKVFDTYAPLGEGFAVILEPSDADVAWDYVGRQFDDLARQEGTTVDRTSEGGVDVLAVAPESGASTPEAATPMSDEGAMADMGMAMGELKRPGLAAARAGDLILAGASASSLRPFIDAASGNAPALDGSADLADVQQELPSGQGLLFAYVNSADYVDKVDPAVFDTVKHLFPQFANKTPQDFKSHEGLIAWADTNGFRFDTIQIPAPGADLTGMAAPNAAVTADQKVADDTVALFAGFQIPGFWNIVAVAAATAINQSTATMSGMEGTPAAMATPVTAAGMFNEQYVDEQLAGAERVLGFNLRDDFFGLFEGEYAFALGLPSFGGPGGFNLNALFTSEVSDSTKVSDTSQKLARLIQAAGGGAINVATRQVQGGSLVVVRDPSSPAAPTGEFGVAGNRFFLGIGKAIDTFLAGASPSLADNAQYKRVMATLPSERYQIGYIDLKRIVGFVQGFAQMNESAIQDADPGCAEFRSQEAAQAAYDADPMAKTDLDRNFNGRACEDFFSAATPEASPVASGSLDNLEAFGAVAFQRDGKLGSSAIIYIGGGS